VYSIGSDEGVLVESELWESEERVWRWMALAGLSCRRRKREREREREREKAGRLSVRVGWNVMIGWVAVSVSDLSQG
jgi:hypothetical protein